VYIRTICICRIDMYSIRRGTPQKQSYIYPVRASSHPSQYISKCLLHQSAGVGSMPSELHQKRLERHQKTWVHSIAQ